MNTNLASQIAGAIPPNADLRAIKPPVEIPTGWLWFWVALVFVLLGALVWWLSIGWRKRRLMLPPVLAVQPHVRARQRLQAALHHIGFPKQFCTLVSDALRYYLEERFGLMAPERTTEEFLIELQTSSHLNAEQKQSLAEFLQSCDLVKFAGFEPNETSLRNLHDAALRLVDQTQYDPVKKPFETPAAPVSTAAPAT